MKYYLTTVCGELLYGKLYFISQADAEEFATEQGLDEWNILVNI